MFESITSRISFFAVYESSIAEAVRFASENGFSGVQIPVELPHLSFESLSHSDIGHIRTLKERLGVRLVLHAHDQTASLWETNSFLQEGIRSYYHALADFADRVEARIITVHIGGPTQYGTDTEPRRLLPAEDEELYRSTFRQNLEHLISQVRGPTTLCVENYDCDRSGLELLEPYLTDHSLALCWDIAKTYDDVLDVNREMEEFFWRNARYIKQVHLHDKRPHGQSHLTIGTGGIDFKSVLGRLSDYDILDYCIEVRPAGQARKSLENLRRLLAE
jgi:sugar phosphate isomerase/epimerase